MAPRVAGQGWVEAEAADQQDEARAERGDGAAAGAQQGQAESLDGVGGG